MTDNFIDITGENRYLHKIGDKECNVCWSGYPVKCKCGGLIHADFGDETIDMDYYLLYKCDKCNSNKSDEDIL